MSATVTDTPLAFALRYAKAGYRVLPLHSAPGGVCTCSKGAKCKDAGKHPRTEHGAHDACADETAIREWWERWPTANIGMTLNDLVAVDVDPRNGGNVDLLPHKLPDTCHQRTGGGGDHFLFRTSNGTRYPKDLKPGIDIKSGSGAYICVEPSIHASGERYVWIDESEPWSQNPSEAPEWIARVKKAARGSEDAEGAIPEGERNERLTSLAGSMRRRGMMRESMEAALLVENAMQCRPPLDDAEVKKIAESISGYAPAEAHIGEWPEPLNIFSSMAAPAFRRGDFPRLIADYADPFARAAGFDFSGVAVACVVAAAGVIPDHVRLLLARNSSWFESPRLWSLLLGAPGSAKSPIIRAATRPVIDLHRRLVEQWVRENPDPDPETATPKPAAFTSDATIEKLSEILRDNPRGLLYVVDEFDSWFGSIDAYRQGGGSRDRGEWLRLYDGGPHQVDRVRRGSFYVPNWGCSLLSATTWATLDRHAKNLPVDGLLQRFLPVILPSERPEPDALASYAEIKQAEEKLEARLLELHGIESMTVHLSADALELFDEEVRANRTLVGALEAAGEGLAAHVAKHAGLLARVALTFHAIEHGRTAMADLGAHTMRAALGFMARAFAHTVALHQRLNVKSSAWPLARDIARSMLADGVVLINARTATQICRAFRSAEDWRRKQAVETLTTCGWVQPVDPLQRYGDHGATWQLNPKAAETFAQIGIEHTARRKTVADRLRTAQRGEVSEP